MTAGDLARGSRRSAIRPGSRPLVATAAALGGVLLLVLLGTALAVPGDGSDGDPELLRALVLHLRLPRIAAGALAGAALAVSGALFQAVTRNPLASPGILGVTAGAHLALVVLVVFVPVSGVPPLLAAFVGGLSAGLATYIVAGGMRASPVGLALAGVTLSLALGALAGAITLFHETTAAGLFIWGAGSLAQPDWAGPAEALPRVALGILLALPLARALDLTALGEDAARSLGQSVAGLRAGAAALAILLAAAAVCLAGPIGFVGLVAPNLLRLVGIRRHALLLPLSALWGAVLLLSADLLARTLGGEELPAGIAAAAVGAPLLIFLLHRRAASVPASRRRGMGLRPFGLPPARVAAVTVAGLAIVGVLGVSTGPSGPSLGWLWGEAVGPMPVVDLRLPRLLVAMLAGAMLAASGTIFQGVTRNPLASPDLMGVCQGAGLAALTVLLVMPGSSLGAMQAAALAGGAGVLALVLLLAGTGSGVPTPEKLVLTGIGVGAFCAAASSLGVAEAGLQVAQALVWLVGSTYGRSWTALEFLLPWAVLLLPTALMLGRWLDLLVLGDDAARSLGLPAVSARAVLLAVATALAAAAVAVVGTIAFVGLVAPHAAAMLCRGGHRGRLLVAALLGALLLGAADVTGRLALAPRELPAGLVTALLGAPYFLVILRAVNRAGQGGR